MRALYGITFALKNSELVGCHTFCLLVKVHRGLEATASEAIMYSTKYIAMQRAAQPQNSLHFAD